MPNLSYSWQAGLADTTQNQPQWHVYTVVSDKATDSMMLSYCPNACSTRSRHPTSKHAFESAVKR